MKEKEKEPQIRGLKSVRVSKIFLLQKLRSNREEHRAVFEEALEGWHAEVLRSLQTVLKKARADRRFNPFDNLYLPMPQDHTQEYDQVIALLEASLDNEFELSSSEFAQYVRDDWGWKTAFVNSTINYVSSK